ncbi:uncharacterized protein LOC131035677 isoform X2 [Cryptomeria japonica]|uniref:uncharacterized protein LOC131035677 isoform X2 n=1 Tax=Cryptomeria japonica TaxID=3369 RepID=UPI0027DA4609|nr:uncharacterized protein LOC131035677 isoform X2 [Cryptomeria japonica]
MESEGALQAANKLITQLQSQVAVLTKRIQDLELENTTRLSQKLRSCHNMHEERESCQVLCNGEITVADSNETNQGENKIEFDIHYSNEQDLSTLYLEDNDKVNFQYSPGEDDVVSGSLNMYTMVFGNIDSSVKNIMHGCHEMDQKTTLGQANIENEPLAKLDTVSGQTEAGNCLIDGSSKFCQVSDIQDDHVRKKTKDNKKQSVSHCGRRYVALKIMYFGQRFYGFASEANMEPTIESELFAAFEKNRLLVGDLSEAQYTRCGRTDKGVSSFGQVIALYLRSNHKTLASGTDSKDLENISDENEIDYVRVLNRALPSDIRVLGWSPVPDHFHARFSCLSREYKYYFLRENLDILGMEVACKKFLGEHDFRNFCKMDALNVHNYKRQISSFKIVPCDERWAGKEIMAMWIKGSAFLWHQVRCMAAVLFMIGQGMESPTVIDELLDTNKTCRKPQYKMASDLPLVLQTCEFGGLNFRCSSDAARILHLHMEQQLDTSLLQAAIFHEALSQLPDYATTSDTLLLKRGRKKLSHVPLSLRPTEPTYEERHMKLRAKSENKFASSDHQKASFSSKMVSGSYKGKMLHLHNTSAHQTRDQ